MFVQSCSISALRRECVQTMRLLLLVITFLIGHNCKVKFTTHGRRTGPYCGFAGIMEQ